MYLSTLRSYVQAIGGELDSVVSLPGRPPLRLQHLGDVLKSAAGTRPASSPAHGAAVKRAPKAG